MKNIILCAHDMRGETAAGAYAAGARMNEKERKRSPKLGCRGTRMMLAIVILRR